MLGYTQCFFLMNLDGMTCCVGMIFGLLFWCVQSSAVFLFGFVNVAIEKIDCIE